LDLTVLDRLEPTIDGTPKIGEQGQLILTGHFPSQPDRVTFEQTYIYEGLGWKLIGFGFNIKKSGDDSGAARPVT
jgi:hypothetical protein